MTDKLPPPLLALFQPRPPLRYVTPIDRAPEDCKKSTLGGIAQYLPDLKEYEEEYPYNATESWIQRKLRQKQEKKENIDKHLTEGIHTFDPSNDPQARGDPFKTLFVSRLSYDVKESDLEREFGRFGPIERIRIVKDTVTPKGSKKPHRGYAFIVYEREKDMKAAYKETDGIRIKDRRVLVDVERGRTVKGWKPRRFGGGLGGRGYTKALPSRPIGPGSFGAPSGPGGYGGGFRGGFGGGGGRGRGGFRNERFGGPRGGVGYQGGRNGFGGGGGQAPPNAPSGPGGGRSGGFGGRYGDRDRGATGSNREPIRPRDGFSDRDRRDDRDRDGGDRHRDRDRDSYRYRDRDRERDRGDRYGGREDYGRKRYHEDDAYDDPRAKRRY
ncbi:U1 small nuclear ribonucleo protein of 70kDa MW N terminal-domain-containing protein [Aspergillus caelatus]|uniref:U1 small nuclear ribonucleo protein of 70kDa MW N terminal-domain-containing protein n=1 Tax=Aspergillus caelatus TaxID=61420 RepID=A0A5N7AIC7_9EURO|nr:U1 small nuclear ribonucleo protein of 70kDa MW N terminal-domain-containing protein [Aspergillus caelatus]KAE8369637.1 U1 small nuclear ribonucleo protein of 70kDa MW N terminal-domain-containing protein [Aspergillus caelatus]